ncbi:MAG: serine/threonine protein kinase, partial [Myxococcota bacterium]|nr:serine/threonine protein kinase [Myxococcota bacterium]
MTEVSSDDTLFSPTPRATVVGGRYSLEQLVAEGGMALVYRGRHIELDQIVAIKLVRPELAFDAEATARFLNEARTIAKLKGPHVARVLDSGCTEPGRPFMVLEYLEGSDLRKLLEVNSNLPVDSAVSLVLEAAEALAEAHASGIVHRDIKPENLFLAKNADGSVGLKVLDFGICKRQTEGSRSFTLRGRTLGSPHYMAPEQITSPNDVDSRVDIWALGVVLYELLTGYQPFVGDTLSSLCAEVVHSEPRKSLRRENPEVPAALEKVVLRCLSKDPNERFATVVDLAAALAPFSARGADACTRIRRMAGVENVPRSITPLSLNVDSRPFRPKRRWLAPVVTATALAAGVCLIALTQPAGRDFFGGIGKSVSAFADSPAQATPVTVNVAAALPEPAVEPPLDTRPLLANAVAAAPAPEPEPAPEVAASATAEAEAALDTATRAAAVRAQRIAANHPTRVAARPRT